MDFSTPQNLFWRLPKRSGVSRFIPLRWCVAIKPPNLCVSMCVNTIGHLTSVPFSDAVCVESLRPAVARAVRVFVLWAVGPPEHFAGRGDLCGVARLLVAVFPSRMAFGWIFESLETRKGRSSPLSGRQSCHSAPAGSGTILLNQI